MVNGPFFVVEGSDVSWYPDLDSVGRGLEAYDIAAYRLFSADGALLQLEKRGRGIVTSGDVIGTDPEALAKSLYAALSSPSPKGLIGRRRHVAVDVEQLKGLTLAELVDAFVTARTDGD